MPLVPGESLGPYEILSLLGAGGMGEVYRARDRRLGRDVAIKVLPAAHMADGDRRRRLIQEARAASAINHPHIVTIHEIESMNGMDFIVMELVDGETLDRLTPEGGFSTRDLLRIAIPIANAMAAAHARGVVHRDLKPSNVIVGRSGSVKILDFGLAKQLAVGANQNAETMTSDWLLSHAGTVAGTTAYMSPEQATAGVADARSDVFSFGAMLYEMATGRRAFAGQTPSETLTAVIRNQPAHPNSIVSNMPESLDRLIMRCLRKEPDKRVQSMADVRVELEDVEDQSDSPASSGVTVRSRTVNRGPILWAVMAIILAAVAAGAWVIWSPRESLSPSLVQLTAEQRAGMGSFSPDGRQIAYSSAGDDGANWDIWLKVVGEAESRRLTNDAASEGFPAWSPDGTQVAFLRYAVRVRGQFFSFPFAGAIHVVSPVGEPARRLSDFPARLQLSWSPDGKWLAASKARSGNSPPGGIHLISVTTGEIRAITTPQPPAFDQSPAFSADGRALAFASCEGTEGNPTCDVMTIALNSTFTPTGTPRRLTEQRFMNSGVAWTQDGRNVIYGDYASGLWRVRADSATKPERISGTDHGGFPTAVPSHDRLAFVRGTGSTDIYGLEVGGQARPLVESAFGDSFPQYSPDGRRIAFESGRAGGKHEIWLADADGSNLTRLTRGPGRHQGTPRWAPDGGTIAFDSMAVDGHVDIWIIRTDGSGLRQLTNHASDDIVPSFSRDGRSVYFVSNRTGRDEVWRIALATGAEQQLTRTGATHQLESLDGTTVYFSDRRGALLAQPAAGGSARTILPCTGAWAVSSHGIFFEDCASLDALDRSLRFWDAATGADRPIGSVSTDWLGGLSASPDGRQLVFGRLKATSDLIMIERFR